MQKQPRAWASGPRGGYKVLNERRSIEESRPARKRSKGGFSGLSSPFSGRVWGSGGGGLSGQKEAPHA